MAGSSRRGRRGGRAVLALFAALATAWPAGATPAAGDDRGAAVAVIVRGPGAAAAVAAAGGTITRALPIIGGVAARVPAPSLGALAASRGVTGVSADRRVRVAADSYDTTTDADAKVLAGTAAASGTATADSADATAEPTAAPDPGAAPATEATPAEVVGAASLHARGLTGAGATVALVDTGVADVAELGDAVVRLWRDGPRCLNLSGEEGCGDSYGHGTFLAGLVHAVAPGARILSVKIAGRDGAADVSQVLAAIQFVVATRDRFGVRVLNLSLGTDSTQDWRIDPLNYAVERAWRSGVTVVAAVSNRGPGAATVAKPADDPWVLSVGALDTAGTAGTGDDRVPDFSARGPTAAGLAKPDLVAPGAHLWSLRSPASAIDAAFPAPAGAYRRGSGTSMAAAVTSGAAALLLGADPALTPDGLKYRLLTTARPVAGAAPTDAGAGLLDAAAALDAAPGLANRGLEAARLVGSLDGSRGRVRTRDSAGVVDGDGTAQNRAFDRDAFGGTWDLPAWARVWGSSWYGSSWYGSSWYGVQGSSWYGSSWYGSSWYGVWG